MGPISRRLLSAALQCVTYPRRTLLIAGVILAACALVAWARLGISTDQNKLFSPSAPFFRDYLRFVEEFPENEAVYILIEPDPASPPPPTARWTAVADAITARLGHLTNYIQSVDSRVPLDRLGAQGILFERPERVREIAAETARSLPLVRIWAEPPTLVSGLLGNTPTERFLASIALAPPDPETSAFVAALARSWNDTLASSAPDPRSAVTLPDLAALGGSQDPSQLGYYFLPDQTDQSRHLLLIRVYPRRDFTSLTAISEQVEAIRAAARTEAAAFPEFRVGITGRPALEADEMRTTDRDTTLTEIAALTTVFMALVGVLGSVRLAVAAAVSLLVGIGWTFGFATISLGELNLLSIVFLIALIGIGMDYLVQFLARYRAEVGRHATPRDLWATVFDQVAAPVTTACLGASGAFLVALLGDFKGAADLGLIAGVGLLLCLLSGYTVLPALLTLFPFPARRHYKLAEADAPIPPPPPPARRRSRQLVIPILWLLTVLATLPLTTRIRFDPGLIGLQAPNLESVELVHKLETWSAIALSSDLDSLRPLRDALADAPTVAGTESILDAHDNAAFLNGPGKLPEINWSTPSPITPAALSTLATRAAAAADRLGPPAADPLRRFAAELSGVPESRAESAAARLSAWQTAFVAQLRTELANLSPPPLDLAAIPQELRGHYISPSGHFALYIYPRADLWDRDNLAAFVREVEARAAAVPGSPPITGIAPNIYHSTGAIERSFYLTTLYALALVVFLVLLDMRRVGHTLMAVSVLALGLPLLAAIMAVAGIPWNFANFFGLPILIGAGHEYGVFLVHRYREARRDPSRTWGRWDASDNALLLCATITISAFGFFWILASHRGLKSLGLIMALGTACIYLAGLLVLRPTLKWFLARRGRSTSGHGSG